MSEILMWRSPHHDHHRSWGVREPKRLDRDARLDADDVEERRRAIQARLYDSQRTHIAELDALKAATRKADADRETRDGELIKAFDADMLWRREAIESAFTEAIVPHVAEFMAHPARSQAQAIAFNYVTLRDQARYECGQDADERWPLVRVVTRVMLATLPERIRTAFEHPEAWECAGGTGVPVAEDQLRKAIDRNDTPAVLRALEELEATLYAAARR